MAPDHTFVNVITGATGSGKTTLINALLALRPEGEHWAVLTNDFGATPLARGSGTMPERVYARRRGLHLLYGTARLAHCPHIARAGNAPASCAG
jgi:energy-coupling factor transporter ATP-binding protein EcfA2